MQSNFDANKVVNEITLLDCQVDLILKSLEFYAYTYQYIYPRSGKNQNKEENLRVSLVRDTYHQILSEYKNQNYQSSISEFLQGFEENTKKVA